jgi:hypothetical protein
VTDVGYVIAGWVSTGVVLVGYWASVAWRLRRRERATR